MDDVLLEVSFEMLQEYVDSYLMNTFPREEVLSTWQAWQQTETDEDPDDDTAVMLVMQEAYDLYDWWMATRPRTVASLDAILDRSPHTPDNWPSDWVDDPKYKNTLNYRQWVKWNAEYNKALDQAQEQDDEFLYRLLEVRRFLWDTVDFDRCLLGEIEDELPTEADNPSSSLS